jgi:hypothetical protein
MADPTIVQAVRAVVAAALAADVDKRVFDGAESEDLKGQTLPLAVVADAGAQYTRSSETEAEVRGVRVEALAKTLPVAEDLLRKAFAALSVEPPAVQVSGAEVTYCHPATGDVTRDGTYDVSQGQMRQRAAAVFTVRVVRRR